MAGDGVTASQIQRDAVTTKIKTASQDFTTAIHLHMGGSYYPIPCSILSTGKDHKTPQRYPDVPTTSWIISIRSMDSFQGLTPKSPSSWHRPLA
ncbi:hypothetical protein Tco_1280041 [Tanacetum coccineum]